MLQGKQIIITMPAYNSRKTLVRTYNEVVSQEIVDQVVLVDDCSDDGTYEAACALPKVYAIRHQENKGYGGNQKTCYQHALQLGADIVIMVHPDYQYTPRLIPAMAGMIANGVYDCVLASRMLLGGAKRGGMPVWKIYGNKVLTSLENIIARQRLSEYHTGYRAFSRNLLEKIDFENNSNGFVFDNQLLMQAIYHGLSIGEISCPTYYHPEASSINFYDSVIYGIGCLCTAMTFRMALTGLLQSRLFPGFSTEYMEKV